MSKLASQVCGRSAKVLLNAGILASRHNAPLKAIELLEAARRVEPTFCDPGYWVGASLAALGEPGVGGARLAWWWWWWWWWEEIICWIKNSH